jgi:hypothetical protein
MPEYRARLKEGRPFTTARRSLDIWQLPRPLPPNLPATIAWSGPHFGGRRPWWRLTRVVELPGVRRACAYPLP